VCPALLGHFRYPADTIPVARGDQGAPTAAHSFPRTYGRARGRRSVWASMFVTRTRRWIATTPRAMQILQWPAHLIASSVTTGSRRGSNAKWRDSRGYAYDQIASRRQPPPTRTPLEAARYGHFLPAEKHGGPLPGFGQTHLLSRSTAAPKRPRLRLRHTPSGRDDDVVRGRRSTDASGRRAAPGRCQPGQGSETVPGQHHPHIAELADTSDPHKLAVLAQLCGPQYPSGIQSSLQIMRFFAPRQHLDSTVRPRHGRKRLGLEKMCRCLKQARAWFCEPPG
jgi:hypothetical protein